jgi:hypothetical protein
MQPRGFTTWRDPPKPKPKPRRTTQPLPDCEGEGAAHRLHTLHGPERPVNALAVYPPSDSPLLHIVVACHNDTGLTVGLGQVSLSSFIKPVRS